MNKQIKINKPLPEAIKKAMIETQEWADSKKLKDAPTKTKRKVTI